MAEEEIREKLQRLMQPTHNVERWRAEVEALDKEQAIPVLLAILNDTGESVRTRSQAAMLLGMLHDSRAVDPLIATLAGAPDGLLRAKAAMALGQLEIREERLVQTLIRGLEDPDDFVRECCAKLLGLMKIPEALPSLERMSVSDGVSTNREAAQEASRSIRGPA